MKRIILTLFVFTGCASFSNLDYDKGDVPDTQFTTESAQCEMEGEKSRTMGGMGGLAGTASYYETFNRVFDACMRSKGYIKK